MCYKIKKQNMETVFLKLLTPELVTLTKPKYNRLLSFGDSIIQLYS